MRILLFALGFVLACVPATAADTAAPAAATGVEKLGLGVDDVELVDDSGKRVRWGELKGRPRAVFFGFTRCPVICPVTVWQVDAALEKAGPGAERVQMNFVTLDPARDTPEAMHNYFSGFKARVRALSGADKALARLTAAFDVVYRKVVLEKGEYTLDHTASVFLLDDKGRVVDVLGHGTPQDVMIARFKELIARK